MKTLDEQIENTKKLLAYLEEQKEECQAVMEAKPELPKMWIPKVGSEYYYLNDESFITRDIWYANDVDVSRYEVGNVYQTPEEVDFEAERRRIEFELRKYIYEHGGGDGEFVANSSNYYLGYNHHSKTLETFGARYIQTKDIYSNSRDILRDAIKAIGEDRIKKYYLRVKE